MKEPGMGQVWSKMDEFPKPKVGVRSAKKIYDKAWVEQTNTATVGEMVRKIVTKKR